MKFLLFILLLTCTTAFSQKKIKMDSSKVEERSINAETLQQFKADKDFQYDQYAEPAKSIWNRFWMWVWYKIHLLLSTKQGRVTVWTVVIILSIAAVAFFVLKVMGMNKAGLFARTSESPLPYNISSDDINHISFDEAIQDAIAQSNFRLALRLLYLQSLKRLSDKEYIDWQINKTNSDYLFEVLNRPWHSLFKSLTRRFEYAWYGEMNIGKDDFNNLQLQFQQFNNQL